jgi:hypothetical protein
MGIDIHAFNFIRLQASKSPLGDVLTIGRQSLSLPMRYIEDRLDVKIHSSDGYCEPLLIALNANAVASIDFSDYEDATFVADLNTPVNINRQFDSVIDAGSLEHIFDVAAAFRNLINACRVGGRIIHILPVNNLNGHGFWQFSSDLIFSIYSEGNGFVDAQVYYASSLDFSVWYKIPEAKPGKRIEIVSVEPVVLLSVAKKVSDVGLTSVVQPFYMKAWEDGNVSSIQTSHSAGGIKMLFKRLFRQRGSLVNFARNLALIFGLASGLSRFSIRNARFQRIRVDDVLRDSPK